jgi:hypothetical protein
VKRTLGGNGCDSRTQECDYGQRCQFAGPTGALGGTGMAAGEEKLGTQPGGHAGGHCGGQYGAA